MRNIEIQRPRDLLSSDAEQATRIASRKTARRRRDLPLQVAVLGAGAWGTALAIAFARSGANVRLWGRSDTRMERMFRTQVNADYLPGASFPPKLEPTADIHYAVASADTIFLAVPSSIIMETAIAIADDVPPETPVVSCAKGIDPDKGRLITDMLSEIIPQAIPMVLSGPSFATEVAQGHPTSVMLAGRRQEAEWLAMRLTSDEFHIQAETDVIGVQIAGAIKNVIAIACGVVDGLGYGANTRASVMARGLEEASTLAQAMGGSRETFLGVAGSGDFALTCSDPQSRNYSLGNSLATAGKGKKSKTFEGAANAIRVLDLIDRHGCDAPIIRAVCALLEQDVTPREMVAEMFRSESTNEEMAMDISI